MTAILGINAYHADSAAALAIDGEIVAAAEEERFRREKHWAGLPVEAIRYCLGHARLSLAEVDVVAVNRDPRHARGRKIAFALRHPTSLRLYADRLRNQRAAAGVLDELQAVEPNKTLRAEFRQIEHHRAHLASSFYLSPFDTAAVVSVDGFGDFASTAIGLGTQHGIDIRHRVSFPHSLGILYQSITQHLGFHKYGDEYKVMGLAPYGQPTRMEEVDELVDLGSNGQFQLNLAYFRHHNTEINYRWLNCTPEMGRLFAARASQLLGPERGQDEELTQAHKDLAASVQAKYEQALWNILAEARGYGSDNLALAGGCAYNSVANGKITDNSSFRNVFIQSAAGDAGGAIGAALCAYYDAEPSAARKPVRSPYLGPEFSDRDIKAVLDGYAGHADMKECRIVQLDDDALINVGARAIADGYVVGWFQGRMEWGPRALGNRSILGDPRRADMRDILNAKIKKREPFRPFAPSILREHVADWFEKDDDVPYMMKVFKVREQKRGEIPAVVHVDGTGRLQTVDRALNPRYHALISRYHALTGVPCVLNTSFNENEPVVCRPEEALECFLRTRMDFLFMGSYAIVREVNVADDRHPLAAAEPVPGQ